MVVKNKGHRRSSPGKKLKKEKFSSSTPVVHEGSPGQNESVGPQSSPHAGVVKDGSVGSQPSLDVSKVKSAVKAVLKLIEDHESKGTSLFSDEACPIHLQITSVKVARTPERQIRFVLPHSLLTDNSDVCLFVADLKKGKKEDHEPTVAHYQDLLERNGVTGITQIIPVRQLKVEFDQYEMKRRLCNQFDCFLSDSRVSGHIRHLLGKYFVKKRKYPTPVKMEAKNLKSEITRGMSKAVLNLHGKGNSTCMTVGHNKLSPEQVAENVLAVAVGLAQQFPGGWENIRSLNLKAPKTLPIPVYLTLKSSNTVDTPRVTPKRPKSAVALEDELSTFPGVRVKVLPSGKVIVRKDENEEDESDTELKEILNEHSMPKLKIKGKKKKKQKKQNRTSRVDMESSANTTLEDSMSENEGEIYEESDDETSLKPSPNPRIKPKKKKKGLIVEKESADEDEDKDEKDIEDAEAAYLSQVLHQQRNSVTSIEPSENKPGDQQTKKQKRKKNKKLLEISAEPELKKQKFIKSEGKSNSFMKKKKKNYTSATGKVRKQKIN